MGLEEYLSSAVQRTAVAITQNKDRARDYLIRYELKDYFPKDISPDEKERLVSGLEKQIATSMERYSTELNGLLRKSGTKGSMWLDVANQLYGYVSKSPIANVTGLSTALFAAKTIFEVPALYRYLKKSKDWYGAANYLALKPLRWLTPVLGPALESGAFERMVMRGVLKESKYNFIKENGDYVSHTSKVNEILKMPVGDISYDPQALPQAA